MANKKEKKNGSVQNGFDPALYAPPKTEREGKRNTPDKPKPEVKVVRKIGFWRRFGIFMLGMLCGIVLFVGGLAGAGFWAYKHLTLSMLESWGVNVGGDTLGDGTGEKNLKAMTVAEIVVELTDIVNGAQGTSMAALESRYGLHLTDSVRKYIPDAAMTTPLRSLFSSDGLKGVIDATNLSYIFSLLPNLLSKYARLALGDKSIGSVLGGDLSGISRGLKLGYLFKNYDFALDEATGNPLLTYTYTARGDEERPDGIEKTVSVPFSATAAGGDAEEGATAAARSAESAETYDFEALLALVNADAAEPVDSITVVDCKPILLASESRKPNALMDALALVDLSRVIGSVSGGKSGGVFEILGKDLAHLALTDLFKSSDRLFKLLFDGKHMGDVVSKNPESGSYEVGFVNLTKGMFVGDLMGYVADDEGETKVWYKDEERQEPLSNLETQIANISIDALTDGSFSADALLDDLTLRDVLDVDAEGVSEIVKVLADTKISDLSTKINTVFLGQVMGFSGKIDGDPVEDWDGIDGALVEWYDGDEPADGLMSAFAPLTVGDMTDSRKINDAISGLTLSDVITIDDDSPLILTALRDTTVGGLGDRIKDLKVGEVMDTETSPVLAALADTPVTEIGSSLSTLYIGTLIGLVAKDAEGNVVDRVDADNIDTVIWYERDKESGTDKAATGVLAVVARQTIDTIGSVADDMTVGDLVTTTGDGTDTSVFGLVAPETPISQLDEELSAQLKNGHLGALAKHNVIPATTATSLGDLSNKIYASDWKTYEPAFREEYPDDGFDASQVWKVRTIEEFFSDVDGFMNTMNTLTMGVLLDLNVLTPGDVENFSRLSGLIYDSQFDKLQPDEQEAWRDYFAPEEHPYANTELWKALTISKFMSDLSGYVSRITAVVPGA